MYNLMDFRECLERISQLLRVCETRFYLTGGAAAIAYGDPRTTQDVDVIVDAKALHLRRSLFFEHLRQEGFLFNEQAIQTAITSGSLFQLIDPKSALKFDLYPRDLVPGGLDRAVEVEVMPGLVLPVASRPDLVISKLIWVSKGSHKSRRDLRQIMLRANEAEKTLVDELANRLKLWTLFCEVLAESDEIHI